MAELSGPVLQPHAGSCHLREAASRPGTQHAYRTARAQQPILTRPPNSGSGKCSSAIRSEPYGLNGSIPSYWETAVLPARTPAGRPVRRGPAAATFHETLALVAAGDAVCTVPDEGRRYNAQTDVVYLPSAMPRLSSGP